MIPTPAYPVYEPGARFAGGEPHFVAARVRGRLALRSRRVPDAVWERTALLWLNYPHNPTGAVLDRAALRARRRARAAPRLLGGRRRGLRRDLVRRARRPRCSSAGIENVLAFHTLSKRSAMTGYRSGFMAGDARLIEALRALPPQRRRRDAGVRAARRDRGVERRRPRRRAARASTPPSARLLLDDFARARLEGGGERGHLLSVDARRRAATTWRSSSG